MINVNKPYLPDIKKYQKYLNKIYKSRYLTNNGPLVQELKIRLSEYLGVKNIVLVANGTMALTLAYKLLNIKQSAITTPFTFVATTSSMVWHNITPEFCDIDPDTLNIDPSLISAAINPEAEAIVPVHVFGNACDIQKIQEIAKKNNLKTIYDASHAFGVKYKGRSILNYGDVSVISFHATKLFHTIEGGGIVISDDELYEKANHMINFGYQDNDLICDVGINAKMSEFHAAMGLALLDDIDLVIKKRKEITECYVEELDGVFGYQKQNKDGTKNYSYLPVIFDTSEKLECAVQKLNNNNIFPRQYFNPSLDLLPYVQCAKEMVNSRDIASRVLCLPLYVDLEEETVKQIAGILKENCE